MLNNFKFFNRWICEDLMFTDRLSNRDLTCACIKSLSSSPTTNIHHQVRSSLTQETQYFSNNIFFLNNKQRINKNDLRYHYIHLDAPPNKTIRTISLCRNVKKYTWIILKYILKILLEKKPLPKSSTIHTNRKQIEDFIIYKKKLN